MVANVSQRTTDWNTINWRKANRIVRNLRQRIFKASQKNDWKRVRSLQKLIMKSYSNTLIAVRRVTQINRGKNTPGIDKLLVRTPEARGYLVDILRKFIPWKPLPSKRIYIPKSNGKKRPLGIPSIIDRCLQATVKNALEPFWEEKFEGCSYGFRPGRSTHDAIQKIFNTARPSGNKKWILEADIKGCFNEIDHGFLMGQIGNFPARKLIKEWLKSGFMKDGIFHPTEAGTPQGGIISPLLANIALHGMEEWVGVKQPIGNSVRTPRILVRYADDFVVFCQSKDDAEKAKKEVEEFLKYRGLILSEDKTRVTHIQEGFDFLGFNIRQYKVQNSKSGYKLLIKPSKSNISKFKNQIRDIFKSCLGKQVVLLIAEINPIIRGWCNYYRHVVSSEIFNKLDRFIYHRCYRFARRTHPHKSHGWLREKYWGISPLYPQSSFSFMDKTNGNTMLKMNSFNIKRHVMVKGKSSPDDPELREYWEKRNKAGKVKYPSYLKVANNQKHKCPICRESLYNGESLHIHHRIPKAQGGKDTYGNLVLLHFYCHQQVHGNRQLFDRLSRMR